MLTDVDQPINTSKDQLHVPKGSMTRSKTKALKEALNALVLKVSTLSELKGLLEYQEEPIVHLIHMQEGPNTTLFWAMRCEGIFCATNQILQIQRMSENNISATQNADVAFQLRAIGQQLELLSRMYKDLKDEVNFDKAAK
jgi:hypothetical protein